MKWFPSAATVVLAGLAGCGSAEQSVKLVPVTGTITMNNKPMPDAQVMFLPEAGNGMSTPGSDVTGPDGNYRLKFKTRNGSRTGVSPGKYKVSVNSGTTVDGIKIPEEFKDDPMAYVARVRTAESAKSGKKAKDPAASQTEFEAEVSTEGGVFDFDVKVTSKKASN